MTLLKLKYGFMALVLASLAACGGGGGSAGSTGSGGTGGTGGGSGGTGGDTPTVAVPASLEIYSSGTQLNSAPESKIGFTVTAKDSLNRAMPEQAITLSASSGSLIGSLPAPKTGALGEPVTSVSLQPGADASNRVIVVTASAGGVSRSISIPVVGSSVSVSGSPSLLLGASSTYTVRATDSAGRAVSGASISVASRLGNTIAPASTVTNSSGLATFTLTGAVAGSDTITVSGLGTTATSSVSISSLDFSFLQPASGDALAVGVGHPIRVRLLSAGVPQAAVGVTFSTSRGTVSPSAAATDGAGEASATVSSTTAGPASITVRTTAGAQIVVPVNFVATAPASLVLQATPTAVLPNTGGGSGSQASLLAVVRDAIGNPVAGRVVNFTAVSDLSAGEIRPGTVVTDAFGQAAAQFFPGALTTGANGVQIRASVSGTAVNGTAFLTVSGQALFISLGVGNQISNYDQTTYQRQFSVAVTDANGAAVANKDVQISLFPSVYYKGAAVDTAAGASFSWVPVYAASCANEDTNRNGQLDALEDTNTDGALTPGLPVVLAPSTVRTNEFGFATFDIRYGENYALWLDVLITARATVGGTESSSSLTHPLYALASDAESPSPAFAVSPFGQSSLCTDPN